MSIPIGVGGLAQLIERVDAAAAEDTYKEAFGFIDFITPVTERAVLDRLNAAVVDVVAGRANGDVYLAPPEPILFDDVEGFLHVGESIRGQPHPELELADYRSRTTPDQVSLEALQRHEVRLVLASTGQTARSWSVYRCLVFETELDGGLFLLSEGDWFAIDRDLAARVTRDVSQIPTAAIGLPQAHGGEQEAEYNARAASASGLALLDKVPFYVGGSQIEVAHLVSEAWLLVHVKRKTQSATLSHLFAQGRVSAQALKADPDLRRAVLNDLEARAHPSAALFEDQQFRADRLTIAYAVIASNAAELPAKLPFFSRLNLWHARRFLAATLDYRIAFVGVGFD